MLDYNGKVAAVTGAASGMGRALAVELARRGCNVSLSDVNEVELAETARLARVAGPGMLVTTARVDVAEAGQVDEWAARTVADHGGVQVLFNNAGVALSGLAEQTHAKDLDWTMGINFWGVVNGSRAFLPHLRASGDGRLCNTSSVFGLFSTPLSSAYNASKFAVRGWSDALRLELDIEGAPVKVTVVYPGGVATNIARDARVAHDRDERTGVDPLASAKAFEKLLQTTTPEKAARIILRGVARGDRKVLVGPDAVVTDLLSRALGSWFGPLTVRASKLSMRR